MTGWWYCTACDVQILNLYHHSSEQHILNCKDKGLYCHPCKMPFLNEARLLHHELQNHKPGANTHEAGGSVYREAAGTERAANTMMPTSEKFCAVCDEEYSGNTRDHLKTPRHLDSSQEKGLYCTICKIALPSNGLFQHHNLRHNSSLQSSPLNPSRPISYANCDQVFPSNKKLRKDTCGSKTAAEGATFALVPESRLEPVGPSPWRGCFCEACEIHVGTGADALGKHIKSSEHIDKCKLVGLYCLPCQTPFLTEAVRSRHNSVRHRESSLPSTTQTSQSPNISPDFTEVNCKRCNRVFQTIRQLDKHSCVLEAVAGSATSTPIPEAPPSKPTPIGRLCKICNTHVGVKTMATGPHEKSTEHVENCKFMGLYCLLCEKPFKNEAGLSSHNSMKHQHRPGHSSSIQSITHTDQLSLPNLSNPVGFNCGHCNQVFQTSRQLRGHLCVPKSSTESLTRTPAPDAPPSQPAPIGTLNFCQVCNIYVGVWASTIDLHLQSTDHIEKCKLVGLYCLPCQMPFLNATSKSIHNLMNHEELGLCLICGGEFRDADEHEQLERHIAACKSRGLYCWECNMVFRSTAQLHSHILMMHPPEFYCSKCNMVFYTVLQLQSHTLMMHPPEFFCSKCNMVFYTILQLQSHTLMMHPPEFFCSKCDMVFYTVLKLQSHTLMVHPPEFRCSECSMAFCTVLQLQSHTLKMHSPQFCCSDCTKACRTPQELQMHINIFHTPSRPSSFHCCDCNKSFSSNRKFLKHLKSGGGCIVKTKKLFSCDTCGNSFSSQKKLNQHRASTKHKIMKCLGSNKCKRTFNTLPAMLQHLESGSCVSKMNRASIDTLMRIHDTTGVLTIKDISTTAGHLSGRSGVKFGSKVSATLERAMAMDAEEDAKEELDGFSPPLEAVDIVMGSGEDEEGEWDGFSSLLEEVDAVVDADLDANLECDGILTSQSILTPESTLTPQSIFTPMATPSHLSSTLSTPAEILTPAIAESSFPMSSLRSCPICFRCFPSTTGLQMHMASPVHAMPMYHCPIDFLGDTGLGGKHKHSKERVFKTLSGLAQHIEAGARKGGDDSWKKTIGFLKGTLKGLGLSEVKLVGQ
ncbi:hypothetical protein BDD12DRAFT_845533 [Trichophaea hybrida]|nr:hypothetical protein BDD12DRAFT_845533 [Trichophaea hybrida]